MKIENSKGDWIAERNNGYIGYRCKVCGVWKQKNQKIKCNCDKQDSK